MSDERPLVSMCVPAFNAARWIREALESALGQTYDRFELLVADNASTDETVEIARSFDDPRVRVETRTTTIGPVQNHNRAIRLSRGAFVKFLHADDLLRPTCLEEMVELALEDDRIGLVCKLHHAMVDGVSVVELGLLLFDSRSDAGVAERNGWEPGRAPGSRALLAAAALDTTLGLAGASKAVAGALTRPGESVSAVMETLRRASAAVTKDVLPAAPTSAVNRRIGPERVLVRHEQPLDELLEVKRRAGVTLNDVCLAVVSGALRLLAEQAGEVRQALKTMVPVSTRGDSELTAAGNRISFAFVDLPVHEADPERRLALVHEQTDAFKRESRPEGFETVLRAAGALPGVLRGPVARLVGSPRVFNLVVSNIPGPKERVYMLGAELDEAYPVVPLAESHALSIGMFSYRDRLFFGCYADPHALPEVDRLPGLLERSASELLFHSGLRGEHPSLSPTRTPAGASGSARRFAT
jgi:WS/DGAT/MGAT family acyltransferase